MIKIYYPSKDFFHGQNTSPIWYEYLLYGFRELKANFEEHKICPVELHITKRLSDYSHNIVVPNNPKHITAIQIVIEGKKYRVWYDWSDFHHYHPEIRKDGDFYFKTHYTKELDKEPRVYPIGQTVGNLQYLFNIEKLRNLRETNEYDLVAIYRTTAYDVRLKAVEILKNSNLKTITGLKDFNPGVVRPYAPKEYKVNNLLPYLKHQELLAKSKYVLALPGVDGSRSWRHAEAWGMGAPLIALDLGAKNPGPYQDCYIKVKDDLSDLLEKIEYYNNHEEERLAIAKRGQEYFDDWISPVSMAYRMIDKILESEFDNE